MNGVVSIVYMMTTRRKLDFCSLGSAFCSCCPCCYRSCCFHFLLLDFFRRPRYEYTKVMYNKINQLVKQSTPLFSPDYQLHFTSLYSNTIIFFPFPQSLIRAKHKMEIISPTTTVFYYSPSPLFFSSPHLHYHFPLLRRSQLHG